MGHHDFASGVGPGNCTEAMWDRDRCLPAAPLIGAAKRRLVDVANGVDPDSDHAQLRCLDGEPPLGVGTTRAVEGNRGPITVLLSGPERAGAVGRETLGKPRRQFAADRLTVAAKGPHTEVSRNE